MDITIDAMQTTSLIINTSLVLDICSTIEPMCGVAHQLCNIFISSAFAQRLLLVIVVFVVTEDIHISSQLQIYGMYIL